MYKYLFTLIILVLATFFLGYNFGWSASQYDELRLILLVLGFYSAAIVLFNKKLIFYTIDNLFFSILFLIFTIFLINFNIFQWQDFLSICSLFFLFFYLKEINYNDKYIHNLMGILVLSSIFPCLFIFISISHFLQSNVWFDYQFNSGNIRIYDSVIVPIFFIAIFLKSIEYRYIDKIYPIVIFLLTLAWLFDGARSALIAIVTPLVLLLLSKNNRKLIIYTFFYMFLAFLLYKSTFGIYNVIYDNNKKLNILRYSTSYRAEMWSFVFDKWKEQPLTGVGGGYLSKIQYQYGHHIHNFYLRLIFEWGLIGILLLGWILYKLYYFFKNTNVPLLLKSGVLAIAIDAMFSGNFIYPASQLSCILFLGLAFSYQQREVYPLSHKQFYWSKLVILLWFILFTYALFYYFGQDLVCWGCGSNEGRAAPNFWYYGGSKHIILDDTDLL